MNFGNSNYKKGLRRSRRGLTSVELANVVTAMLVAASVLAFTLFNTSSELAQEASQAASSSLAQVTTVMVTTGHVIAHGDPQIQMVVAVRFYVKLITGGSSVDFNESKLTITYYNGRIHVADAYGIGGQSFWSDLNLAEECFKSGTSSWCLVSVVKGDEDAMLEEGEIFMVILNLKAIGYDALLNAYETFTIEIIPHLGAPLTITKKIPPAVDRIMDLG
ncbi:MAG: hypothetical protein QW701_02930 [Candidatus Nezhaarchaeales archaeon]